RIAISLLAGVLAGDLVRCTVALGLLTLALLHGDGAATAAPAGAPVDLQLIIGVDTSRSMDEGELRVQRDGYVQAFRSAEIVQAISSGFNGRIAVMYFEWGGEDVQSVVVPWTLIDGAAASAAFADRLSHAELTSANSLGTSISAAILYAASMFDL